MFVRTSNWFLTFALGGAFCAASASCGSHSNNGTLPDGGIGSFTTGSGNTTSGSTTASASSGSGSTGSTNGTNGAGTTDGVASGGGSTSAGSTGGGASTSSGSGGDGGTSGATSGTSDASGGDAGASGCTTNGPCSGRSDDKLVCSVPTGECVQCLDTSDCLPRSDAGARPADAGAVDAGPAGPACVKNVCVTYTACGNSLACAPMGQVCDPSLGHCVQCASDVDCAMDERCADNTCRKKCQSDNTCTPLGLLCDTSVGYCTSCVAHSDCPATSFCSHGECARDVCVGGSSRCQQNGVSVCSAVGSGWGAPTICAGGQTCSESNGTAACKTWTCTPSTIGCAASGEKVVACSSDGLTATEVTDCAAQGRVCVSGACVPVVCPAGTRYCDNNDLRTCSTKGDSSTLTQSCGTASYCDPTGSPPSCKTRVCTPDQPACSNQIATTCNSVGSGYLSGGIDCAASSQVCVQGACANLACAPSSYYCNNGNVYHCSADGLTSTLYTTCTASQYCDSSISPSTCKLRLCTAGQPACDGTVATTCNADGSGYTGTRTDCATSSLGCTGGICSNSAVDTADPSPTTGRLATSTLDTTNTTKLDFYSVTSSRTLQKIEMYLGVTSSTLTWVVYEAASQNAAYALVASSSTAATGTAGSYQYYSSGPLSVPLTAGHYYAIGVGWTGTVSHYFKNTGVLTGTTSFGSMLGGYTYASIAPATVTFNDIDLYAIRLTTAAP